MKYKFLINAVQIIISGYLVYAFLESLRISGPKPDYLSWQATTIILPYLAAYVFIVFISRRYNQLVNIISLISISLLGSFIFSCYNYVQLINESWNNYPEKVGSLLIPVLINLFIFISIIFFIISAFLTGCIWMVTKGIGTLKQKVKYK